MRFDIITFGSGTRDVYLVCRDFKIVEEKKFVTGRGIAVSLGSKIEVNNILFRTGGGGTNSAATFKAQGYKVAWCGMVGRDIGGREIVKKMRSIGIDTRFVFFTDKKPTNYSVVMCAKEDRTILVYHGASSELPTRQIPWHKIKETRWFYLAPLAGKLARSFAPLVNFAKRNGIYVAANPGNSQLRLPASVLRPSLEKLDILFLNQEEAALLAGMIFGTVKETELLKKLYPLYGGIIAITRGPEGAVVTDGVRVFSVPVLKTRVIDRTGAGDAFASAFVSEFMRTNDICSALQFGIANSAACISHWGAQDGLLKKNQRWKRVPVKIGTL